MSSKIKYQKNYTEFNETYQLVLPLSLEGFVPDDDSVRLLSHELEELDYTLLYKAYSSKGRNPAVTEDHVQNPNLCLFPKHVPSPEKLSRPAAGISTLCGCLPDKKPQITVRLPVSEPDFSRRSCEDLFYQMVRRLKDAEELSMETVFIDGTKLEACANKYTFVWKKSVGKWEEKMFHKIQEAVRLLNHDYMQSFTVNAESRAQDLQKISGYLEEKCQQDGTEFVYGRGRRKSKNQKYLQSFQRFRERQVTYDWHTASFQGRNNYCKTDPDATFMHMKDDHMRNAQLKPGYNIQIGVDSEYIVSADVFQDRNDVWTLVPFLKMMDEKLGFRYPSVTADSGYESEEGYTYLRSSGQKPYIKPQTYEKWKKRSFKQDISKRENMGYDKKTDTYTCHPSKKLKALFAKKQKSKSGYESEVTVYECEDCTNCPHKEKCTVKGINGCIFQKAFWRSVRNHTKIS